MARRHHALLAPLLMVAVGGMPAARASSAAAWAEASRQATGECRFWLGHRGYTVLGQLPLDSSGRLYEPTEEGFLTLWQVRMGSGPLQRLECRSRRPLFRQP